MGERISRPIKLPTASGNVTGVTTTAGYLVEISAIAGLETSGFPVSAVVRSGGSTGPVVCTISCPASNTGANPTPLNIPVTAQTPVYCQIIGTGVLDATIHVL